MSREPSNEVVNARIEEIKKRMPKVKHVIIKIKYELETGRMEVQHSPKKRYDPDLILGLLLTSYQWLLKAFVETGKMKPPEVKIGIPEKERTYIG